MEWLVQATEQQNTSIIHFLSCQGLKRSANERNQYNVDNSNQYVPVANQVAKQTTVHGMPPMGVNKVHQVDRHVQQLDPTWQNMYCVNSHRL